jgi:hypothetical protein
MDKNQPKTDSILLEAEAITNGARNSDYGSAKDSFSRIASIATLLLSETEKYELKTGVVTDTLVVKVLVAVKLGRQSFRDKRDNLVDACGYLKLLDELLTNVNEPGLR